MCSGRFCLIALLLTLFVTAGCSSMLNVGRENFICQGDGEGGSCSDPESVMKNKTAILGQYADRKRLNGNAAAEDRGVETIDVKLDSRGGPLLSMTEPPVPVRQVEKIQRIWINAFPDDSDNMIGGIWAFAVVKQGVWKLPDGRDLK